MNIDTDGERYKPSTENFYADVERILVYTHGQIIVLDFWILVTGQNDKVKHSLASRPGELNSLTSLIWVDLTLNSLNLRIRRRKTFTNENKQLDLRSEVDARWPCHVIVVFMPRFLCYLGLHQRRMSSENKQERTATSNVLLGKCPVNFNVPSPAACWLDKCVIDQAWGQDVCVIDQGWGQDGWIWA